MAGYFKKRRRNDGPNKNEEKVARGNRSESGSPLGELFPGVERLSIKASFFSHQKNLLDERTLNWGAADRCDLKFACVGRCGEGSFDLTEKVRQVVAAAQAASEASGTCAKTLYAGLPDTCGCELKCRLDVAYAPVPPELKQA